MTKSVFSSDGPIFGREIESSQFENSLSSASEMGKVVLVVGQAGMGKSTLLRKFRQIADTHPKLECSVAGFELSELDSPETFLEKLLHETFGMARHSDGKSWIKGPNAKNQIEAIFGAFKVNEIYNLFDSLVQEKWEPNWQLLLEFFSKLSMNMPENRRIVFLIDPKPKLQPESGAAWFPIFEQLSPKFVFVFAQLPDDAIVCYPNLRGLNIERIPEYPLAELDPVAEEKYIEAGLKELGAVSDAAKKAMHQYGGWPYAIRYALQLLKMGSTLDELPKDPGGLIGSLLKRLSNIPNAEDAISTIYGLAVLEVPITLSELATFLGIPINNIKVVLDNPFVVGLIRRRNGSLELFHNLFYKGVCQQIKEDGEWKNLHGKTIKWLNERLKSDPKDLFALRRLAFHVREVEGIEGYIRVLDWTAMQRAKLGLYAELFPEVENAIYHTRHPIYKATFITNLGVIYSNWGNVGAAEEKYREALAIYQQVGNKPGIAKIYSNIGLISRVRRDFDSSETHLNQALDIYKELNDRRGIASVLDRQGALFSQQRQLDIAEEKHTQALTIYRELGDIEGIADCLGNLGILYKTRGDLKAAEKCYSETLVLEKKLGRKEGLGNLYINLGVLYKEQGILDSAEEQFQKALVIEKELDRQHMIANNLRELGSVYLDRGDIEDAEAMLYQSLAIDENLGRTEAIANDLFYLGSLHLIKDEMDNAEKMLLRSIAIDEELGKENTLPDTYSNLALIYLKRGNFSAAGETFQKSLGITERLGKKENIAQLLLKIGFCYFEKKDFKIAVKTFEKSCNLFKELDNQVGYEQARELLIKSKKEKTRPGNLGD